MEFCPWTDLRNSTIFRWTILRVAFFSKGNLHISKTWRHPEVRLVFFAFSLGLILAWPVKKLSQYVRSWFFATQKPIKQHKIHGNKKMHCFHRISKVHGNPIGWFPKAIKNPIGNEKKWGRVPTSIFQTCHGSDLGKDGWSIRMGPRVITGGGGGRWDWISLMFKIYKMTMGKSNGEMDRFRCRCLTKNEPFMYSLGCFPTQDASGK